MSEQATGVSSGGRAVASSASNTLYMQLAQASVTAHKLELTPRLILAVFDDLYLELCEYPLRAKIAFEARNAQESIQISKERLGLYSSFVFIHAPQIKSRFPQLETDLALWDEIDARFEPLITARYEADIAFAFVHSLKRNICNVVWTPVAYSFIGRARDRGMSSAMAHQRFAVKNQIETALFLSALQLPRFKVTYARMYEDAEKVANRLNELMQQGELDIDSVSSIEFIEGAFFRDRTAFLVGRMIAKDGRLCPLALALLNSDDGIVVDAVLYRTADVHNLFSSTLANFHVTNNLYYQICVFLASTMPLRPLGLHYSTIGFNHVGKVAILDDIKQQLLQNQARFSSSPGEDGTVAIGFTFNNCSYHLKVIRDHPTKSYKWGEFQGIDAVMDKYRQVHEINRAGSMVDNVIYTNLELDRSMFVTELLDNLLECAGGSVQSRGDKVLFRCLIVQLKIIPLPIYFKTASEEEIERAVINLGHCIQNNLATNIFNKDLDARNYGVGRYGRVFLFDYDAVERFTDVHLASTADMDEGEEDVPDWFFSKQFVFLPEELESGLQIRDRYIRRRFREINERLLTLSYWEEAQQTLVEGGVLETTAYPDQRRL